jgi:regulator of RNase E activity RraB
MDASWDVYTTHIQDKPAFVMVDSALANLAPLKTHPDLVECHIVVNSFRENGFPDKQAFEKIYGFEDVAGVIAKRSETNIYAGRRGIGGEVAYYFYTGSSTTLIKDFETSAELKAVTPFVCSSQSDLMWFAYFDNLYPKPDVRNKIENTKVRDQLLKAGDDSTAMRQVDHFAYFKSADGLKTFKKAVENNGYTIVNAASTPDERGLWALAFSMKQIPAELDPITWTLSQLATATQGIYDGWACPVVTATK